MPRTPHIEHHFQGSATIRDIVIGMSDGLTVPFALAAGLSSASAPTSLIVTAGLAEIAAGSISMGLGGYLAGKSDAEHYAAEQLREEEEIRDKSDAEKAEVSEILQDYGLTSDESATIVDALSKRPKAWVDFMMRFELGLESPDPRRALISAATIAGSYIVGGLIPLSPYFFVTKAHVGLYYSSAITLLALLVFGAVKGHFTAAGSLRSALQTALIGGVAATAAFILAKLVA